jgi:hypothetical protein
LGKRINVDLREEAPHYQLSADQMSISGQYRFGLGSTLLKTHG